MSLSTSLQSQGPLRPRRKRKLRRPPVRILRLEDCREIADNCVLLGIPLLKQVEAAWVPARREVRKMFRLEKMERSRRNLTLGRLPVFRQAKILAELIHAPKCSASCAAEVCNSWLGERTEKLIQWFYRTAMPPENLFRGAIRAYFHPRPHKEITRPRDPNLLDEVAMSVHGGQPFRERPPRPDDKVPIDLFKQATENSRCDMQMLRAAEFVLAYGMKQTDAAARYGVSQRSLERNVQKFRKMVLSLEPEPHSLCEQQPEFAL